MGRALRLGIAVLGVLGASSGALAACLPPDCTDFPKDAGFLNVLDYGAHGDGVTDDTAAINAALSASGVDTGPTFWHDRIVYFPAGTYLVSAPIMKRYKDGRFGSGSILIGQSRDNTIIRLKDKAEGYADPAQPKAIIFTSAKLLDGNATSGGKDYKGKGEGNDAYMNYVENMTVDAGEGNPGAIGIDYLANNMGAVRNVAVRGEGAVGISLARKWPGPALLQNVSVSGFAVGIDAANTEYGVTFDHIQLEKHKIALRNNHNVLSMYDVAIKDAQLPISNESADGLIVIQEGSIDGSGDEAIANKGFLTLRSVKVSGYKTALGMKAGTISGAYQETMPLADARPDWALPVENAPPPVANAVEKWVGVSSPGDPKADATDAIRKAFASGATTIYFPHGTYLISDNIEIPASVQRIVGMTSTIHIHPDHKSFKRTEGMFRARNSKPLLIEKLAFDNSYLGDDQIGVEASGSGAIVLRDVIGAGVVTLHRDANGGEAFIENTCCGTLSLAGNHGVWARQLDTEGMGVRIKNNGAPLWVLGLKTERDCTVLENTGNARTEILGGLLYITGTKADPAIAAFRNKDSKLFLSYAEEAFYPTATYTVHLSNTYQGKTGSVTANALPKRNAGRMVPALVAQ